MSAQGIEGYDGVVDVCPAARPDVDILRKIDALRPSQTPSGDRAFVLTAIDALIVAITTMLSPERGETSKAWTRILYLFVRSHAEANTEDVDAIANRLAHDAIELRIMCVPADSALGDAKGAAPLAGLPVAVHMPLADAMRDASAPVIQLARSAPARMLLTFGAPPAQLAVPVSVLKATAHQRPPVPMRVAPDGEPVGVRHVYFRASDEEATPLPPESEDSFQRAYRLGASLVPTHDVPATAPETHGGLEIMHFIHAATVRRR